METLQHSMELDLEEWDSSAADSPASRLASPESAAVLVTAVISGPKCSASSLRLNPDGSWQRTSQDCLPSMEVEPSGMSSLDWPRWAIVWDGECFPLTPLELATEDSGCSSLPTPKAWDGRRPGMSPAEMKRDSLDLKTVLFMLPTPRSADHRGAKSAKHIQDIGRSLNLPETLHLLPTPNAFDAKGIWNRSEGPAHKTKGGCKYLSDVLATPVAADSKVSHGGGQGKSLRTDMHRYKAETGASGALNPSFVEAMMGFPPGWSAPTG